MGQQQLRRGRVSESGRIYLVTICTHQRQHHFTDFTQARIVVQTLNDPDILCASRLLCWVLMPDHLHMLLQTEQDTLPHIIQRIKATSARRLNRYRNADGTVWQRGYHDRAIRQEADLLPAARYIIANPKRAGLVHRTGQYPHWDAIWV